MSEKTEIETEYSPSEPTLDDDSESSPDLSCLNISCN
jgi:hypothetical protein